MKRVAKFLGISLIGIPTLSLVGSTFYLYPDLRRDPYQYLLALNRVWNVAKCSAGMIYVYKRKTHLTWDEQHYEAAEILKVAFLKNAGLYAKFGQIIASLDIVVPIPYKETFSSFFMECPSDSYESVKQQIEDSTGKPIDDIFKEFHQRPISSASIAQVHYGVLHNGQEVAVKIQHPWLRSQAEGDLRLIELFVDFGERLFKGFKYKWFAEEIRINLPKELDFKEEVSNLLKATQELQNLKNLKIPFVIPELCNDKIITMEFIRGTSLLHLDDLIKQGYDLKKISTIICQAFTQQLYRFGFVHADPHQGNIIINGEKDNPTVVLLDHGLYTTIDNDTRLSYSELWKAIIEQDEDSIKRCAIDLKAGENYQLFSSMIASQEFDEIMTKQNVSVKERLGRPTEQEKLQNIANQAVIYHKEITNILGEMNRSLILLLKINDFLRNIDFKLGSPINNFEIIYKEVYDVSYRERIAHMNYVHSMIFIMVSWITKLKLKIAKIYLNYF